MARDDTAETAHPADPPPEEKASGTPAAPVKKRSPVERAIVWGFIGVLGFVTLFEGLAAYNFKRDLSAVETALGEDAVTESELKQLVKRADKVESNPELTANELGASRIDTHTYSGMLGLFKDRFLYVYYGVVVNDEEAEVINVTQEPVRLYTRADFAGFGPQNLSDFMPTDGADAGGEASVE